MHETNGALTNGANDGSQTTSPAESSPVDSADVNGQASAVLVEPSLTSASAAAKEPSAAPVEKVLDESLDEEDIKVSITLTVHGHKIDIMKRAFEKTFYDAFESSNRGMLFSAIKNFLEHDVYEAIAVKINRKVPVTIAETPTLGEKRNGKHRPGYEPIPPYTGLDEDDEDIKLHITPPD